MPRALRAQDGAPPGQLRFRGGEATARRPLSVQATILDVAPTVLVLLGLPISSAMLGAVLNEVVEIEFPKLSPIRVVDERVVPDSLLEGWRSETPEVEDEVRERLRALGYLE